MPQHFYRYGLLIGLFFVSPLSHSAGITLGAGATLKLGDGAITLNCTDLAIAAGAQTFLDQGTLVNVHDVINNGQLDAAQGSVDVAGDWRQQGSFIAGTSTVNIVQGCGETVSAVIGSSVFYTFSAASTSSHQLIFEAGVTQQINNSLALSGSAGNLLTIRSSAAGQAAFLNLSANGIQSISFIDVADNHATGRPLAPGTPASFNSVNSGNTSGWFEILENLIFENSFE